MRDFNKNSYLNRIADTQNAAEQTDERARILEQREMELVTRLKNSTAMEMMAKDKLS